MEGVNFLGGGVVSWATPNKGVLPMSTDTRIESLENQVRTLKRMLFGVFGLVVVGGLLAATSLQSVPDVIQAKKFEVLSDDGNPVVVLSSQLLDRGIDVTDNVYYGSVSALNSKGGTLVTIGSNNCNGTGQVATFNGHDRFLVLLGYNQDTTPGLTPVAYDSGLVTTFAINGGITSNSPEQSDELCCQHPHHLECIVNTTTSPPGSCKHSHHLECGVITTE